MEMSFDIHENTYKNIIVVGYVDGMAILEDEWNSLFYYEIPEEFVTLGEVSMDWNIQPISNLSDDQQKKIVYTITNR